jgi:hypothetical protein
MPTLRSIKPAASGVERVVLEMSLKPFMRIDEESVTEVCREVFRQWYPLLKVARECSILLWVADGTEILVWNGDLGEEMEWGRYIGFCNGKYGIYHGMGADHPRAARLYMDNPPVITFGDLQRIIRTLKKIAAEDFGLKLTVGETFDPGPEFAHSEFKYEYHKEIIGGGPGSQIGPSFPMVNAWSTLNADKRSYAGYPHGVPAGTTFGEFLGRQTKNFLDTMGFDYLWLSNGFGFSHFAWSYLGVNFDGDRFGTADYKSSEQAILTYWRDFKRECKDTPIEVRGTNFAMAMDLASDFTPYEAIYSGDFIRLPPPNSPWGPLNKDFGLEMIGYMSRIAVLPDKHFLFRYYPNDPWFWQNPWWDWYDREPFDIYCPMSVGRMNGSGAIENPQVIQFLTIDTEKGIVDERCPLEVIPHIRRGIEEYPNEPGILTWLYPFDEYHTVAKIDASQVPAVFFGDWFARSAVNSGLPLNTILSTRDFKSVLSGNRQALQDTVLFTPTTILEGTYEEELQGFIESGGRVMFYGPLDKTPAALRSMLNIGTESPISGELELTGDLDCDVLERPFATHGIRHHPPASGGGIVEIVANPGDTHTRLLATAVQDGTQRAYALYRDEPEWGGGGVGWIRGTNSFATEHDPDQTSRVPRAFASGGFDPAALCRLVLAEFGFSFVQHRASGSTRPALTFVSRRDNGYFLTGYAPDSTVSQEFRFPLGAPLLTGKEAHIRGGRAGYHLERSFHSECRVFLVNQPDGVVSCTQTAHFPSDRSSRLLLTGIKGTDVIFLPPRACIDDVSFMIHGADTTQRTAGSDIGERVIREGNLLRLTAPEDELAISW